MVFDLLEYGFMQRALLAGLFVALSCSLIGVFLVLRRLSLIGDGLAHIAFGGLAVGVVTGTPPFLTALIAAVLGALGINYLRAKKIAADAAIAVIFSIGLAVGIVLISASRGFSIDIFSFLFGSILAVSTQDVWIVAILGAIVLASVILLRKELLFITFDEECATAAGLPVRFLNVLLLILTAITVVVAIRVVGVLLVSSLIVLPTLTARQFCRGFNRLLVGSALMGVIAVFLGLVAAFYLDMAAGGAIVLVAGLLFVLAVAGRGIVRAVLRSRSRPKPIVA
jgi:zinc transport system permease protein